MPKASVETATDTQLSPELTEIIMLPSGRQAIRNKLKGRDFFRFQEISQRDGAATGLKWATVQMFKIFDPDSNEFKPLTIGTLEDDLDFEDAIALSGVMNKVFTPFLPRKES